MGKESNEVSAKKGWISTQRVTSKQALKVAAYYQTSEGRSQIATLREALRACMEVAIRATTIDLWNTDEMSAQAITSAISSSVALLRTQK